MSVTPASPFSVPAPEEGEGPSPVPPHLPGKVLHPPEGAPSLLGSGAKNHRLTLQFLSQPSQTRCSWRQSPVPWSRGSLRACAARPGECTRS